MFDIALYEEMNAQPEPAEVPDPENPVEEPEEGSDDSISE